MQQIKRRVSGQPHLAQDRIRVMGVDIQMQDLDPSGEFEHPIPKEISLVAVDVDNINIILEIELGVLIHSA